MKWAGHKVRMKDERLPKRAETKKKGVSKKGGRPQLRWEDCLKGGRPQLRWEDCLKGGRPQLRWEDCLKTDLERRRKIKAERETSGATESDGKITKVAVK